MNTSRDEGCDEERERRKSIQFAFLGNPRNPTYTFFTPILIFFTSYPIHLIELGVNYFNFLSNVRNLEDILLLNFIFYISCLLLLFEKGRFLQPLTHEICYFYSLCTKKPSNGFNLFHFHQCVYFFFSKRLKNGKKPLNWIIPIINKKTFCYVSRVEQQRNRGQDAPTPMVGLIGFILDVA